MSTDELCRPMFRVDRIATTGLSPAPTTTSKDRTNDDWVCQLSGAAGGRDEALGELRRILVAGLARAVRQFPSDSALVQDSAQEALLLILNRLQNYRDDGRFVTWPLSIATRGALSEMRRARWKDVSLDKMSEAGRLSAPASQDAPVNTVYEAPRPAPIP